MKTSKEFTKNLNNNTITDVMLAMAIYSVNKRAKNYRDKAEECFSRGKENQVFYDGDKYSFKNAHAASEAKKACYEKKAVLLSIIEPVAIHRTMVNGHCKWFLLYKIAGYSFHSPVTEEEALASKLNVVELENFATHGAEINDLVSVQFIDRLIELINNGNYNFLIKTD